jgi:DNA-binding HxlR family transcriptional regulator
MSAPRTYRDPCGIARALDLVGERWALLIVRELLLGPKRFTDLRAGLPHVSADVLSQRLRELEQHGVLRRGKLPPPAGSQIYELTRRGHELEPVVLALGRWGSGAPFPPGGADLGVDATVIALKTVFDPALVDDHSEGRFQLRLNEQPFCASVAGRRLELGRGEFDHPDASIETNQSTFTQVLWHGRKLGESIRTGELKIDGDRAAAERFMRLFPAPQAG